MRLVIDESVGLKWAISEPDSALAAVVLAGDDVLLVPDFWLNEAANVLWVQTRRRGGSGNKGWSADEVREGLSLLRESVDATPTADLGLHETAIDIALTVDHSPYDCLYAAFALAVRADHILLADAPFAAAMRRHPDPRIAALPLMLGDWALVALAAGDE